MKKYFLLLCIVLFATQSSFSQKLFFAKENYTDSTLLQKNIIALAKEAAGLYAERDSAKYYDNLFRLQIVAGNYDAAVSAIAKLALINFGDAPAGKAFQFGFKMYSTTMLAHPKDFSDKYNQLFTEAYYALNQDGRNRAERYFNRDPADIANVFKATIFKYAGRDSLSIEQTIDLCRSYCSVIAYTPTTPLAQKMLKQIDQELYIKQDSVLIKMPDGGTISLTVVRSKKASAPQPVVMMYNIYSFADMSGMCKEMASRGYAGIIADTRGKRLSPDAIEPFEHDGKDAYYIIDWISKQPWCNGKVGMYGGSYLGFSQWSAAKYMHPALKTIVPQVAVGAGIDYPQQNGVFMTYILRWLHYVTNNKLSDNAEFSNDKKWTDLYSKWFKEGSSFRSLDTLEGRPHAIFQRWLQHPAYDSYWQNMTPQKEEFAKISIPIFTTTGYWDDDQIGAMYYYRQYQKYNKSNNYYLLIGPYDHGGSQGFPRRTLGGYTIDSVANIPIMDIVFQWFDYTLKDSSKPAILKDKVNFEVMGSNTWKHVASLSRMSNDTLQFYLGNTVADNHYPLLSNKPKKIDYINQSVDLRDRTEPGIAGEDITAFPSITDSVLHPQKHRLVFVSDPIEKPFAISGAAAASIKASINKKDMDLGFDMYEQTPDGKYIGLVSNLQRASYSVSNTKRNLLVPGKTEIIEMKQTFTTCRQLQKGSRIVVIFGINKNSQWQINYGTGKDVSDETMQDAQIPMEIKWYNSSYISIPILR